VSKLYLFILFVSFVCMVELSYNNLGLCDTVDITFYILWYQLVSHTARVFLPCLV